MRKFIILILIALGIFIFAQAFTDNSCGLEPQSACEYVNKIERGN
jgi:hypothetical protein